MTGVVEHWLRGRMRWLHAPFFSVFPQTVHAQADSAETTLQAGMSPLLVVSGLSLVAVVIGVLCVRTFREQGHLRALRHRVDRMGLPAAITRYNGVIEHTNAAMNAVVGDTERDFGRALGRQYNVRPATVYRLALGARDVGFSFVRVERRSDGEGVVLSARFQDPNRIVWALLPTGKVPTLERNDGPASLESVPFPRLRIGEDGTVTANSVFFRNFGHPEDQSATVDAHEVWPAGGTVLLERRGGGMELCRAWAFSAAEGDGRGRDVLFLPAGERIDGPGEALEAVPVALMQFDLQGRLLWANAHAGEMVGKDLQPGTALAELFEPLGRSFTSLLNETAGGSDSRREMVRLRDGASDTFLHISLTPVTLGGTSSLLAVLSDASELRQLEERFAQSQKMEAVGKLAGGVAHDFNNVLTAISGHSDLLLLGKDTLHPDYSDLMQIRQNAHRAAALVRQLLAFSRKQTLKPQLLSVQDVVADTQYLLGRLIGEKVSLSVDHGADLWMVRADQQQFEQALMNLVVNARDAMPKGGTVTIRTRNVTHQQRTLQHDVEIPAGPYVEIQVSDTGTGLPPHVLDRIFEPFFTTKPRGEGTGLGLSTVYGIVKQSGGYIFAENQPEGGARFRILLPRAEQGEDEEIRLHEERVTADRRDLTGRGIVLLVEDEDPVRSFASRALKLRGYEVIEAASAEEAMSFLAEEDRPIDVLVSDVVMPGMDGPTFATEARRMRPDLRVVFVSGYAEDSFRRSFFGDEFLFLPKPFSLADLTAKVKQALSQSA